MLSVVSIPVKLVSELPPLKLKICSPPIPPTASSVPDGDASRAKGVVILVEGMVVLALQFCFVQVNSHALLPMVKSSVLCGLPVLGRECDSGAAEGVIEPGVFSVGRGEKALQIEAGSDARDERARAIEKCEEAVPIDSEQEGMIGREEGSADGKRNGAAGEIGDSDTRDKVGSGEFGNEDEFFGAGGDEGMEKAGLKKRLEAAFHRHPDGMGFEEALELVAAGGVGEVAG